ncbi:MAG: NAD(P)H-dependent oxidoreductase [Myxococcales bacterium]
MDVPAEQVRLLAHELIVLQFPLYWYSVPPLLKQWFDLVLTHGWAYGTGGTALRGKVLLAAVTTGGRETAYTPDGLNHHTLSEFLFPVEQTARMCGLEWWAPFLVQGTHLLDEASIARAAAEYRLALEHLRDGKVDPAAARTAPRLNDLVASAEGGR